MRSSGKTAAFLAFVSMAGAAPAQDWTGVYGGLSASRSTGGMDAFDSSAPGSSFYSPDLEGRQTGAFLGYALQQGNLVYGGELAWGSGDIADMVIPQNHLGPMLDLKARVGYAMGKTLIYGTLGWTRTGMDALNVPAANEPFPVTGVAYGLGVDMMVGARMFLGAEVLRRDLEIKEGDIPGFPTEYAEHALTTVTLRLGLRF